MPANLLQDNRLIAARREGDEAAVWAQNALRLVQQEEHRAEGDSVEGVFVKGRATVNCR